MLYAVFALNEESAMKSAQCLALALLLVTLSVLPAWSTSPAPPANGVDAALVARMPAAAGVSRLIVTLGRPGGPEATLQAFEKKNGIWEPRFAAPALTGRNGVWPTTTEGARRTPAGVYNFTRAFGTAPDPGSLLPYTRLAPGDLWVDDPASRFYNQWVKADDPAKDWNSAEDLSKEVLAYKYAVAFDYNMNPTRKGAGSAFFLHCSKGAWTAGCVSVPEGTMARLLQFINKDTRLVIADSTAQLLTLGPRAYSL